MHRTDNTPSTNLQNKLHHFCMDQAMHRLTVDMGDEVTLTKPCFTGWTTVLHMLPQEEKESLIWSLVLLLWALTTTLRFL